LGTLRFAGIKVKDGQVSHKDGRGPVAGCTARVESAGEIDRRLSATRVLATGGLGLFWKKKVDHRTVYLTIEGDGFSIVEEVGPKVEKQARKFAAQLATLGRSAPPPPPVATSTAHLPPPTPTAHLPPPPPTAHLPPPPAPQAPPLPVGDSMAVKLRELADLHRDGVLDEAEFAAAKAKLLT
jgi:hypothetical protein